MTAPHFAGVFDRGRRHARDAEATVRRAVDDESGRVYTDPSLVLAWVGAGEPAGSPLGFLHGTIYAGAPAVAPGELGAVLAREVRRDVDGALNRLRGDFILVVHDGDLDELVLVRDQLGGLGVVWHEREGRLSFASEVRYLLPLLAAEPGPDPEALAHWLSLSGQPKDRTMFAGVQRLEEGALLRAGRDGTTTRRYWNPRFTEPVDATAAECTEELRTALRRAVQRRCADRPVPGVLLSGGLDSSSVAGAAAHLEPEQRPSRAYSATFPDHPSVDEGELIGLACDRFGLTSTRVVVHSGSVVAGALEYLEHWRLPPPSPNLFFWFPLLRRAAGDGVTVLLDGEGGDELFGLSPYLLADRLRHGRMRSAFDLGRRIPGGTPTMSRADVWPFVREFGVKGAMPPSFHRAVRHFRRADRYTPSWLRPELQSAFLDSDTTGQWKELDGPRWWAYLVAATSRGMGAPITFDHVRRRAALVGLAARHPLIDVDVIERMLTFPPELAFDPRYSRPILRAAVRDWVPDELRLRHRKSTFDAIFHEALVADLDVARALLRPGEARLAQYVDLDRIDSELLTTAPPAGGERLVWAQHLWRLLTAECWLRGGLSSGSGGSELPPSRAAVLELREGP